MQGLQNYQNKVKKDTPILHLNQGIHKKNNNRCMHETTSGQKRRIFFI